MEGVRGNSDTEARPPAVSMISETLARSGPGESLRGQVILGPHHARGESYPTSASHNFTGQRNALSGSAPLRAYEPLPSSPHPLTFRQGRTPTRFHGFYDHGRALPSLAKAGSEPLL